MKRLLGDLAAAAITFWLGTLLHAQAPPGPVPDVSPLLKVQKELADAAEQLALARANLALCQAQVAPAQYQANVKEISDERDRLRRAFEQANPGWTVDLRTLAVSPKVGK